MIVFCIAVFILLGWLMNCWWSNKEFFELAAKIPQVEGYIPLIGIVHKFIGLDGNKGIYNRLKEITKPGISPRKIWAGHLLIVIVDDPAQLQLLLNSKDCTDKLKLYETLNLDRGLLASKSDVWKIHRKLVDPAFNYSVLKSFVPIFNAKSQTFVKVMEEHDSTDYRNLLDSFSRLSLDNILSTSTGLKNEIQTERNNSFLNHCLLALDIAVRKAFRIWLWFQPYYVLTKTYQLEQTNLVNGLQKIANEVIKEREKYFDESSYESTVPSKKPQIFIDQLLKNRDKLSHFDMQDEIKTIIIAGFETVSTVMSLLTLLVAIHPDVQEKIFEELQDVFESADEEVTEEKLSKLTYLELVLKETMRFWPAIPFIGRRVTRNIEIGGYTIPAGANIGVPIIHIHRNKSIWGDDADEFKPERFLPENFEKIPSYAYLPFARGLRNCIGYRYAMISMKIALAYLFRNFKISTSVRLEDVKFEFATVSKLLPGYNVSIHRREFGRKINFST